MRLKSLFFPIILLVSVLIFSLYVWPEISNVRTLNMKKIANEKSLQDIRAEQSNIKLIGTKITNNSAGRATVNSYLSNKKSEEKIIGGINYLATDSEVSIQNVSLQDVAIENPLLVAPVDDSTVAADSSMMVEEQAPFNIADKMGFTEANILINGKYDKIKLFIDQLQRMALFNDIKSLTVSQRQARGGTNSDGTPIVEDLSILSAEIVIHFGYLPSFEVDSNIMASFKPEFDEGAIDVLNQYISQKTVSADYLTGDVGKGKPNPFIP